MFWLYDEDDDDIFEGGFPIEMDVLQVGEGAAALDFVL